MDVRGEVGCHVEQSIISFTDCPSGHPWVYRKDSSSNNLFVYERDINILFIWTVRLVFKLYAGDNDDDKLDASPIGKTWLQWGASSLYIFLKKLTIQNT